MPITVPIINITIYLLFLPIIHSLCKELDCIFPSSKKTATLYQSEDKDIKTNKNSSSVNNAQEKSSSPSNLHNFSRYPKSPMLLEHLDTTDITSTPISPTLPHIETTHVGRKRKLSIEDNNNSTTDTKKILDSQISPKNKRGRTALPLPTTTNLSSRTRSSDDNDRDDDVISVKEKKIVNNTINNTNTTNNASTNNTDNSTNSTVFISPEKKTKGKPRGASLADDDIPSSDATAISSVSTGRRSKGKICLFVISKALLYFCFVLCYFVFFDFLPPII